ncbi:hypothetical protein [Streptomyces sp. RerS4]|uniref:hypothetical protein n=1 Tax=Streptomyces sp. RerS4 TaxID=2942449 RepID=UPI00201C28AB|nr:hypothetical protein [Streptomyces sp. RerS4]UQW99172.1 hypothetical protein M4D82_00420 [Streptomyces sp. RerS4]
MADEPTAYESEILAASLRAYLSETGFAFTSVTAAEATAAITRAVAEWAKASGWKCREEASMRYIDPPRPIGMGCRITWWPPRSAYLDLRLLREDGPPIAVEIDREDIGTAVDKLRDEALRGRPALWIRWHGAARAELPAGVARLRLPTRATRSPIIGVDPPMRETGRRPRWFPGHERRERDHHRDPGPREGHPRSGPPDLGPLSVQPPVPAAAYSWRGRDGVSVYEDVHQGPAEGEPKTEEAARAVLP